MRLGFLALSLCLWPSLIAAQVRPIPSGFDSRIQSVAWSLDEVVRVAVPYNAPTTIEFGRDEAITNVLLSDTSNWQVFVSRDGSSLNVRVLRPGPVATLTVRSDKRTYSLELEARDGTGAASVVRYVYLSDYAKPTIGQAPLGVSGAVERYKLKGDKALRPDWIGDDGHKTFIRWNEDRPLPAVFAVDSTGREMTVDGQMRGEFYTIDRIWPRLVFRIDRKQAIALREKQVQP